MEPKIYGFYNINVELTTIYFWFHERDHEITRPCSTDYKPSQGQKYIATARRYSSQFTSATTNGCSTDPFK